MIALRKHLLALGLVLVTSICTLMPCAAFASEEEQTIPLVMVVVEFDGGDDPNAAVRYDTENNWAEALFGQNDSPAAYYRDMSAGVFTFVPANESSVSGAADNTNVADRENDGIVHVTLHRPHGAWGAVNVDRAVTKDFARVVIESLQEASSFIDFPSFDANGDGSLSRDELAICICVAGYEASAVTDYQRGDIPLLWAHSGMLSVIDDGIRSIDGLRFEEYIAIAEYYWDESGPIESAEHEPLGVVYHELGHALGLPDLYAVTTTTGPWEGFEVGAMSLMDSGGWQYADDGAGMRNIPTALDAWSRYVLGWTQPVIAAKSGDYTVSSQLSGNGYSTLLIPTSDPDEYFLVENRQAEGQDISLNPEYADEVGIVVWHVDNGMYERYYDANCMNDANHRPAVMDEQADGELLLYDNANDTPDARVQSGIVLSAGGEQSRDMVVHVEMDNAEAARNTLHLLHDAARTDLGTAPEAIVPEIATVLSAVVR